MTWNFRNEVKRIESSAYTSTTSNSYETSASISIEGKVFGIGDSAEAGFAWTATNETSSTTSSPHETTLNWSISGELHPGETAGCQAVCRQGNSTINYISTVTLTVENGAVYQYSENGIYASVAYSTAEASVLDYRDGSKGTEEPDETEEPGTPEDVQNDKVEKDREVKQRAIYGVANL